MNDLAGRTALVTGGSGGIGSAITRRLAAAGIRVAIGAGANLEKARRLTDELPGTGHFAVVVPVDDSPALSIVANRVREQCGGLDILVNCAGVTRGVDHSDLDGLDDELIDRIFRINWRGPFAAARAFRSLLDEGDSGVIINISSIAAVTGMGSNVAYCASKAALDSMTRSLARALAPRIRVLSVSPGLVLGDYTAQLDQAWIADQVAATPLGRLADPDDVAEAVLMAISLRSTTGAIIPVDGGRPLGR